MKLQVETYKLYTWQKLILTENNRNNNNIWVFLCVFIKIKLTLATCMCSLVFNGENKSW